MKIHHNTAKKAVKFGITLSPSTVKEGVIAAVKDGKVLASGTDAKEVLEQAIAKLVAEHPAYKKLASKPRRSREDEEEGDDEDEGEEDADDADVEEETAESDEDEEGEGEEGGKSVVKKKYKTKYKPFKMTCGDDLSQLISAHVKRKNDEGKMRIDPVILKKFAQANGVWDPNYANLNVGMRRMNIANRLRAKVKEGHEVVWAS